LKTENLEKYSWNPALKEKYLDGIDLKIGPGNSN
jgi:hypothetical protein